MRAWRLQTRGGPSMRKLEFEEARTQPAFDARLAEVLARVEALILNHGVFHAKLHFSTGQVALWLLNDPLRYRVHVEAEFLDPDIVRVYPRLPYTAEALVPSSQISNVLTEFRRLRECNRHRHIHLLSGSLNVVNGLVGLNFSCDGNHYLNYAELLSRPGGLYR